MTGADTTNASEDRETLVLPPPRPKPRLSWLTAALAILLLLAASFYGGVRAQQAWGDDSRSGALEKKTAAPDADSEADGAAKAAASDKAAAGKTAVGKAAVGWAYGAVTAISGRTLFVASKDGSIVAVEVPADAHVTKTQGSTLRQIRPGDIVTATGEPSKNGVIVAASLNVGGKTVK